jgi:hypothetical protein
VALLVGKDDTIAEVTHFDSRYYEIQDTWRSDRDTFVRTAEDRFSMDEGYVDVMVHSVSAASGGAGWRSGRRAPSHERAAHGQAKLRLTDRPGNDVLHESVGDTGCAAALLSLVAASACCGACRSGDHRAHRRVPACHGVLLSPQNYSSLRPRAGRAQPLRAPIERPSPSLMARGSGGGSHPVSAGAACPPQRVCVSCHATRQMEP